MSGLAVVIADVKGRLSELRLAATRLARRQSCYNLCERLLREELNSTDSKSQDEDDEKSETSSIFALMSQSASRLAESDVDFGTHPIRAYREVAKLLFGRGQTQDAIEVMTTTVSRSVGLVTSLTSRQKSTDSIRELSARSLLSMSKWLQADSRLAAQYTSLLQMSEQTDTDTFTGRLNMLVDMARTSQMDKPGISIELLPADRRECFKSLCLISSA